MPSNKTTHEFAFFIPDLDFLHNDIRIVHEQAMHRITHVLRLQVGDVLVVFNNQGAWRSVLAQITKKNIICYVQEKLSVTSPRPSITVLIPVLKKEALEQAVYNCVELGVTQLVLIKTAKSHAVHISADYKDRLMAIAHAAQEQAKQYAPISLTGPYALETILKELPTDALKLVADPQGKILSSHLVPQPVQFAITAGPESDFSNEEKELLLAHGFLGCSLGATVLRAQQALTVLVGAIRSLMS